MVSVFTVYNSLANTTRWVTANEEGFSLQTADTITSELYLEHPELLDKVVLGAWQWDALVTPDIDDKRQFDPCPFDDEELYLYTYCRFEFLKEDCKYFGVKVRVDINELPTDLYIRLTDDYRKWATDEGVGCLTDGYDVFMDEGYEPSELIEPQELTELKSFKKWYDSLMGPSASEDDIQKLYDSYITIAVAGNSIKIPFDAENYGNVWTVINRAIEEF